MGPGPESGWELQQAGVKSNGGLRGRGGKEGLERDGRSLQCERRASKGEARLVLGQDDVTLSAGDRRFKGRKIGLAEESGGRGRVGRGKERARRSSRAQTRSNAGRDRDSWQRGRVERGAGSRRSRRDDGRGGQLGAMTGDRRGLSLERGERERGI